MQVYRVDKNMMEQISTVPYSIYREDLNPTMSLTSSTPGLVIVFSLVGSLVLSSKLYCSKKLQKTFERKEL